MTRLPLVLLAVLTLATAARAQTVQPDPADEQAIRDLIALHAAASQHGDFDRLVAGYHADTDVQYPNGPLLEGQEEIEQHYRTVLSRGPTSMAHAHPSETIRVRFLRPDLAFVDVESVFGGGADGAPVRVPFFLVFTKVEGEWGVAVERVGARLR
jgi:uncharacterized protein (TIGR02246 family)